MKIAGLQKLTLLDYKEHLACIVFTQGCNFNCGYCHNSSLIDYKAPSNISEEEVFAFLNKRKGILTGVVISGGEPTMQSDLKEFISKIKKLGYEVKLDTNGANPKVVEELIDESLVDYIAMDIKYTFDNYSIVTGNNFSKEKLESSIKAVKKIAHEFRTTLIKNVHDIDCISSICSLIGVDETLYLQNFTMSDLVRDKTLRGFTNKELEEIQSTLNKKYPNVKVRV